MTDNANVEKPYLDEKKNFSFIKCSGEDCNHTLLGIGKNFFAGEKGQTLCLKCESEMRIILFGISEEDPSSLLVRFECPSCSYQTDRIIAAIRRYCPKCKKNKLIYIMRLLDANSSSPVPA